ncbi:MAG: tRNA (adenosine(37)-N6)-threonylcarbamoyltransferase complex dimerization subunit type 1 TsaB [Candidatus Babeliaceae bacterium]|nr:tRNA (adenosine(37)-N6)-threonylcarbamoyltransferase complex dimerization subunit type 1 TsaB [Candidatus Babeliaceae bacterium]
MHHTSRKNNTFYLVVNSGYQAVGIGLYCDTENVSTLSLDKKTVSAFLMQSILELLQEHALKFSDLSFISTHSGPAPFTTLRVGIATVNGIGFATGLPLIGINGLKELSKVYPEYTVILNAFCDDVYIGKNGKTSCENIDIFLQEESAAITKPVTYIGNGVALHYEKIKGVLGKKVQLIGDYPYEANIELIAQAAYDAWQKKERIVNQVIPIYLKQYSAKIAPSP